MKRIPIWLSITVCLTAFACTRGARTADRGRAARPDKKLEVKAEIDVNPTFLSMSSGQRVIIRVYISNMSDDTNTLEFDTSRQYSVFAIDDGGRYFQLEADGEPFATTMSMLPKETKLFEVGWDGHVWSNGQAVYLPPGRYELEARIADARSNTMFVTLAQ